MNDRPKTVREMVTDIQREVRDTPDLQPERAAHLLTQLSALLGNINGEIRQADMAFNEVLLKHLESESKANRAKIRAETTPEYQRKREARDLRELAEAMIASLKYLLKSYEAEMRLAR